MGIFKSSKKIALEEIVEQLTEDVKQARKDIKTLKGSLVKETSFRKQGDARLDGKIKNVNK